MFPREGGMSVSQTSLVIHKVHDKNVVAHFLKNKIFISLIFVFQFSHRLLTNIVFIGFIACVHL